MLSPGEGLHAGLDDGWLLDPPAGRTAVHTRSIVCRSFRRDDGLYDIDARFADTRTFDYTSEFRGAQAAGSVLHHMQMRVTFDRQRHIVAVQVAMPGTPYEGCGGVLPNFQRLVGLSLARGFRKALRERIGGAQGCTHLIALLDAVAAAAVQTLTSSNYQERAAAPGRPVRVFRLDELLDTCWSYRQDSPVVQRMRALNAAAAAAQAAPSPTPTDPT